MQGQLTGFGREVSSVTDGKYRRNPNWAAAVHRSIVRRIVLLATGLVLALSGMASAESRVALVIGVAKYKERPLVNPANDARAIAKSLRQAGFEVTELIDPDRQALLTARSTFAQRARGADAAMIYYAGHGVEIDGVNYLLPVDVNPADKDSLKDSSIQAASLKEALGGAKLVRYLILDACRDNPFADPTRRSGGATIGSQRGLGREAAKTSTNEGVGVLFATSPGDTAADAPNKPNSPFAESLSRLIGEPGLRLASLPGRIAKDVKQATGRDQAPDYQGILENAEDWAFIPGTDATSLENAAWQACAIARSLAPCEAYVQNYPAGRFVQVGIGRIADLKSGAPAPVEAIPNVLETIKSLGISVSQGGIPGSILVGKIAPKSPAEFQLQPGDVILKVNDAAPPAGSSPGQVLNAAIDETGRAKLLVQRGKILTVLVLRPTK